MIGIDGLPAGCNGWSCGLFHGHTINRPLAGTLYHMRWRRGYTGLPGSVDISNYIVIVVRGLCQNFLTRVFRLCLRRVLYIGQGGVLIVVLPGYFNVV